MNFVCIVFELGDKMLSLSSMENLIVQCQLYVQVLIIVCLLKSICMFVCLINALCPW